MPILYNDTKSSLANIFRATSGGTVFSADLRLSTSYDLFDDSPTVGDCIYFGGSEYYVSWSDLYLNIGTAMAGTDIVLAWEYCVGTTWRPLYNLTDNTVNLTVTGAQTVQFPHQPNWAGTTINGQNKTWVRCRLVSFTTVTEGGAVVAQTQRADGKVTISGYTDASPCTFLEIYNWIVANAPQIGAHRIASDTYKFDCCSWNVASTLRTTSQKIFMGCGGARNDMRFDYIWSGTKVGTDGWKDASYFFFCYTSPGATITFNRNEGRVYGGEWGFFSNIVDGLVGSWSGYIAVSAGEMIGTFFQRGGYFASGTVNKCRVEGSIITANKPSKYPTNLTITDPSSQIWSMYGNGLDVEDITFALPSESLFYMGAQYALMRETINIDNPNPAFPSQTSAPRVVRRVVGSAFANITSCLFYDASAGTFTDYTTEANNATVDDVPINGDVGDCLYILPPSVSTSGNRTALTFTITTQANDYVYAFEYYRLGSWYQIPSSIWWDLTENFTKTGVIYPAIDGGSYWQNVTINGTSALWLRIRIVTKGTGTPMLSRIQHKTQTGICDVKINERYTFSITVLDINNTPIQNATVVIKDKNGTTSTLSTDANGKITPTKRIVSQTYFDKDTTETDSNYKKDTMSPFEIFITKTGYETYYIKKDITAKIDETIALKKAVPLLIGVNTGKDYLKLNPDNLNSREIIID